MKPFRAVPNGVPNAERHPQTAVPFPFSPLWGNGNGNGRVDRDRLGHNKTGPQYPRRRPWHAPDDPRR